MPDQSTPQPPGAGSPPPVSVALLVTGLGKRLRAVVEVRLADHGLALHHLAALGHLSRDPGLSYSELARRSGVTVQSMQSTIAHLHDQQLVERGAAGQGRRAELQLTTAGRDVLAAGEAAIRTVDDELLVGIDPAERAQVEGVLMRIFRSTISRSEPARDA